MSFHHKNKHYMSLKMKNKHPFDSYLAQGHLCEIAFARKNEMLSFFYQIDFRFQFKKIKLFQHKLTFFCSCKHIYLVQMHRKCWNLSTFTVAIRQFAISSRFWSVSRCAWFYHFFIFFYPHLILNCILFSIDIYSSYICIREFFYILRKWKLNHKRFTLEIWFYLLIHQSYGWCVHVYNFATIFFYIHITKSVYIAQQR
jgi:hypothetical protein